MTSRKVVGMASGPNKPSDCSGGLPRVLVVEDDELVRDVIQAMLEDCYEVISVPTSNEGIAVLKTRHPDVVLLDFNLNGECGTVVAEQTHQLNIPTVVMSGDLTVNEALGGESRRFLAKPFSVQQLLDVLDKARA